MSDELQDAYPVDHSALLERPEDFKALIEIDGKQDGAVLTGYNAKSMVAQLQFLMITNAKRISGYVVRTMPAIEGSIGDLVASVAAASFTEQMVKHSRLNSPAPKDVPSVELQYWDTFHIKPKERVMNVKNYVLELVIDGIVDKFPVAGANDDSVIALLMTATCQNMPRISGWNLYTDEGKLIASVPAMMFLAKLAELTSLSKKPADPKSVGWRALPAVAPINAQFQKDIEAAKNEGKNST